MGTKPQFRQGGMLIWELSRPARRFPGGVWGCVRMKVIIGLVLVALVILGGGGFLLYYANSLDAPKRTVTEVLPDDRFPQPK